MHHEIPPYIKEIRSIDLTLAGQCSMTIFSDRIVRFADSKMLKGGLKPSNPFAYFMKICHDQCREKNIQPDYDLAKEMHAAYGTHDKMPMLQTLGRNTKAVYSQMLEQNHVPVVVAQPEHNPFTDYYASLSSEERQKYDNDPVPPGYRHATPDELKQRQDEFMQIPAPSKATLAKFPSLVGLAARVFNNLRFVELQSSPTYKCTCTYRRKYNQDYKCYMRTCPHYEPEIVHP